MQIFYDRRSLSQWVAHQKDLDKTIGFVPTMGALHQGHLSLIKNSQEQNDFTVCSIFVNPTQFDNSEDLDKYPRTTDKDIELLKEVKCDILFLPTIEDMYPEETSSEKYTFDGLENQMEGRFRQGHFDGVATIVSMFFDIVKPDKAYFGEKDFQQLRIIQSLVEQKNYPIEIVPVPIHREKSGLAMSSRNARLTESFSQEAIKISEFLKYVKANKERFTVSQMETEAYKFFNNSDLELEYFMICDEKTLEPIKDWQDSNHIRAFIAAYAGDIRLIDNLKII